MDGPAERSAPSVFVSYAREDDPFVQRLCRALDGRDHQAWIDQIDLHPFDPDWVSSVHSAIEACTTFLVVISPESLTSKACAAELAHAVAHNKRLAPILYRDVDESAWSQTCGALGKPNWFLFRESDDFERSMQRLIDAIETDLEWVGAHARLLVRAKEWEKRVADVLTLTELREAERWLDGAGSKQPSPLPLHTSFIRASRESADQELAGRLLIHAEREAKGPARNIVLSVLLALESYRLVPSPGALEALRRGLLLPRCIKVLHEPRRGVSYWSRIAISSDGRCVAINDLGRVDVLEVTTGHRVFSLEFSPSVSAMCLSPSGRYLGTWRNVKERTENDPFPYGPFEVFRVSDGHRIVTNGQSQILAWAFSATNDTSPPAASTMSFRSSISRLAM